MPVLGVVGVPVGLLLEQGLEGEVGGDVGDGVDGGLELGHPVLGGPKVHECAHAQLACGDGAGIRPEVKSGLAVFQERGATVKACPAVGGAS